MMPLRLILALLLFTPLSAFASADLPIQQIKTKSGITAWLVEDKTTPVISLQFSFKNAGSKWDVPDKQGTAQLLSNTLDEGAGKLDAKTFQKKLADESIGLVFTSSRDDFGGSMQTLRSKRNLAFDLLKIALTEPRFDTEAVERMRASNLSRLRSNMTDPDWLASRLMLSVLFKDHPYGMNTGGTLASLRTITPDDLRKFKEAHLTRDKLVIGVSGNINAAELEKYLEKTFASLPEKSSEPDISPATFPQASAPLLYQQNIPQTIIRIAMPALDATSPDIAKADVFNHIFGASGFGSRLMENVREKAGLTYGIYSGFLHLDHADLLQVSTSTKNITAGQLLALYKKTAHDMQTTPPAEQELQETKDYLVGSIPLELTSTEAIASFLLTLQLDNRPVDYLTHYISELESVTAEDVKQMAGALLSTLPLIVLVGMPEGVDNVTAVKTILGIE
ncbi:MAG: insulinase family protein [Alphaproteobacteria bacterium]|nr:insulinase family protein [Alphaproteobacteria bacterium]